MAVQYSKFRMVWSSALEKAVQTCPWHIDVLCFSFLEEICYNSGFPGGASGKEPTCQYRKH